MTHRELVQLLLADVDEWNRWREQHPHETPELAGADLRGANLLMANLSGADLLGADLTMANLEGADLTYADLRKANLVGARLIGVELMGANLCGTDLRTAEDFTPEQLEETVGDETTLLPDEFSRPHAWTRGNLRTR